MAVTYPYERFKNAGSYFTDYASRLYEASKSVDPGAINQAAGMIESAFLQDANLYVCGNGGSAAISNHMTCDVLKGIQTDTDKHPRIVSLSNNVEIITAIANDIAFEDIFCFQFCSMVKPEDILMTISSSGDSENIVRTLTVARERGIKSIALTGFDGGRSAKLADVNIHVQCDNYGIIEDLHQSVMHTLAQFLRMRGMPDALIAEKKF